jgi:hypothetical protein
MCNFFDFQVVALWSWQSHSLQNYANVFKYMYHSWTGAIHLRIKKKNSFLNLGRIIRTKFTYGIKSRVGPVNRFRSCMCTQRPYIQGLQGQRSRIHENSKSHNCHLTYHVFSWYEELHLINQVSRDLNLRSCTLVTLWFRWFEFLVAQEPTCHHQRPHIAIQPLV